MSEVTFIGLDIAKSVFQAHGADARGQQLFSCRITRGKVLDFFVGQPRCLVTVAQANKTARIVWALMMKNENYKAPVAAVA